MGISGIRQCCQSAWFKESGLMIVNGLNEASVAQLIYNGDILVKEEVRKNSFLHEFVLSCLPKFYYP